MSASRATRFRSCRRIVQVGLVRELDADEVVPEDLLDKVDDPERTVPPGDSVVGERGPKDPLRLDEVGDVGHGVDEVLGEEDVGRVGDGRGRRGLLQEGPVRGAEG